MPFIGNQPALSYTSFAKQDFTTSATTSYTLDNSVANANELALFINFVRQEPTTAYSASGTTLTLTEATSSSDDMYCVYLGKAVQTVTPPNNSVTSSMLASGNLTIPNGNLLFDTADKGIYLGVTSATASNLLDDYEYGNWTPVMAGGTSAGTYAPSEQQGHYVKVGKQVTAWFNLSNIATTSAGSGALYLTGLPFTINWQDTFNGAGIGSAELNYFSGISGDTIVVLGSDNTDFLLFYHSTGTNNLSSLINVTDKNSDSADIRGFVTYYTGG